MPNRAKRSLSKKAKLAIRFSKRRSKFYRQLPAEGLAWWVNDSWSQYPDGVRCTEYTKKGACGRYLELSCVGIPSAIGKERPINVGCRNVKTMDLDRIGPYSPQARGLPCTSCLANACEALRILNQKRKEGEEHVGSVRGEAVPDTVETQSQA